MRKVLGALGPVRVPLLGALVLVVLPFGAFVSGTVSGLVRGLFDLEPLSRNGGIIWRTAFTCGFAWAAYGLAAVAVYQSASIILDFAPQRLDMQTPGAGRWLESPCAIPTVAALCTPAIIVSMVVSLDPCEDRLSILAGALLALIAAAAALLWLRRRTRRPPPLVGSLRAGAKRLEGLIDPRGYVQSASPEHAGPDPFVHHAWAVVFVIISSILWLFVAIWARAPWLQDGVRVPALCSLMLLVMLSVWILSGLTFFLDAYRFPILSAIVIVTAVAGFRDHTFATQAPTAKASALLPQEVMKERATPSRIVVIAAAGGGIQAAGWTARVLHGLVRATPPDKLDELLGRLVVVSGVSGGSVGLAPFVAAIRDRSRRGEHVTRGALVRALRSATDSSLDPVAASFATSDLIPLLPLPDRGDTLEASWRRAWRAAGIHDPVSLADLAPDTLAGKVPGVMFNATDMTTGERLVIGTTVPNVRAGRAPDGFVHAAHVSSRGRRGGELVVDYQSRPVVANMDLAVAARLSATFPYVTPASHRGGCPPGGGEYVVDGGYVDNYGIESLMEWLEPVIGCQDHPPEVDIVQIVSFPEGGTAKSGRQQSWFPQSQLAAPVEAVLNVRAPGQGRSAVRNVQKLTRFAKLSSREPSSCKHPKGTTVCSYRFVYDPCDHDLASSPPLSWHLTPEQKRELDDTWNGCPNREDAEDSYDKRAHAVVWHVLGLGPGECTEIQPTTPPQPGP